MNAVIYVSKSGNTQKLAEAVAKGAGVKAQPIVDAMDMAGVDVLFIGGSPYCGKISKELRRFLQTLKLKQAAKVAVFGTSASGKSIRAEIMSILEPKGIKVSEESFQCKGAFLFINHGHPDNKDLAQAEDFAKQICAGRLSNPL
jgi:flavodoxin